MKLNHLDLQVSDVQDTAAFFEQLFDLRLQTNRTSPAFAILRDGAGFTLVLQRKEHPAYPNGFHLGFNVDDVASVERVHSRARDLGHAVSDILENGRGTMIYCQRAEGYLVEVSCSQH